ncbi:maleylpyruvate isomerase family mycothiol-dependent enzyme [Streptomyces sp. NPDC101115]|uniref:maleylpyruvate isomerase family mycothiol-dependent enzyme n=1 Tax=Streptomyces sp. NPDC101115 TaxID=3366106 RepID=UPI003808FE9C
MTSANQDVRNAQDVRNTQDIQNTGRILDIQKTEETEEMEETKKTEETERAQDAPLHTERLAEGLREQTAGFAHAVAGRDPDARVPTCPEWSLGTLVGHVGQEHRWTARLVRERRQLAVPDPREARPGPPDEWAGWLREGAEELIGAIRETGAKTVIETFFGPRPAGFWLRRMLGDTGVHHYDAAFATGTAFGIADDLAADVIGEHLGLLAEPAFQAVRPALVEPRGRGERIGFRPGSGRGWLVTRTPEGPRWARGATGDADVVVSGAVTDLMLVVSGRVAPEDERLSVTGDRVLLHHWLARSAL